MAAQAALECTPPNFYIRLASLKIGSVQAVLETLDAESGCRIN